MQFIGSVQILRRLLTPWSYQGLLFNLMHRADRKNQSTTRAQLDYLVCQYLHSRISLKASSHQNHELRLQHPQGDNQRTTNVSEELSEPHLPHVLASEAGPYRFILNIPHKVIHHNSQSDGGHNAKGNTDLSVKHSPQTKTHRGGSK